MKLMKKHNHNIVFIFIRKKFRLKNDHLQTQNFATNIQKKIIDVNNKLTSVFKDSLKF